jgi:hypothetical protein
LEEEDSFRPLVNEPPMQGATELLRPAGVERIEYIAGADVTVPLAAATRSL